MTTVVYKDGVLAADSMSTVCDRRSGSLNKIFQVGDFQIGVTGCYGAAIEYIDFAKRNKRKLLTTLFEGAMFPEQREVSAIIVHKSGKVYNFEGVGLPFEIEDKRCAMGSGAPFALAAMECGKSAVEAIEIAAKFDLYTGGDIKTVKVASN